MIARKKKLFGICLVMIFISCHESQTKALSQDDWQKISLTPHNSKLIEGAMPLVLQKDYIICLGQNQNNGSVIFKIDLVLLWQVTLNNSYHRRFGENHQMKKDFSSSVQLLKRR